MNNNNENEDNRFDLSGYNGMTERLDDFQDPEHDKKVYDLDSTSFTMACVDKLQSGDFTQIIINPNPSITNPPVLIYESSNFNVVTVDRYGTVVARKEGTATITATDVESGYKQSITIKVVPNLIDDDDPLDDKNEDESTTPKMNFLNNNITFETGSNNLISLYYNNPEYTLLYFTVNDEILSGNSFTLENDSQINVALKVNTPEISVNDLIATITCTTANATILYSVDDSEFVEYSGGFEVNSGMTIKAFAQEDNCSNSETVSFTVETTV